MEGNSGLDQRTVLVTGAARRLGRAIVRCFHHAGMRVAIHYNTSRDDAQVLCDELNQSRRESASVCQADLLDNDALAAMVAEVAAVHGSLDVLVNNASAFYPTPVGTTTEQQWDELMGTNLKAPYFLTQAAAPYLAERQGVIVNMVDIYGWRPLTEHPVYSAAKAGLIMLTQSLANELAPRVRVNAIAPGAILQHSGLPETARSAAPPRSPLARWGEVEEIARAALFLTDSATYTTGVVLPVDGGRHTNPY